MRYSNLFGKTSKTEGKDYKIDSHRLLVQAGFIRESSAGRYFLLPLGLRVHDKIIDVIRKHMENAGAQEVVTPVLHPLELWKETNRTTSAGFELMTIKDRRGAEFALGGTAEEMIVDLVRKFNISYKDLPFNLYQFSMKFRDELRARGGLLRVREFVMKDAYSFGTEEQFKEVYQKMWRVYSNIFNELDLKTDVVAADNGYIGGEYCHEFVVESRAGESKYFITKSGDYAAHEDVASFKYDQTEDSKAEMLPIKEVEGKGIIGVEELSKFLNIPVEQTTKTILFENEEGDVIAAAVRGDFDINETKLQSVVKGSPIKLASADTVKKVTGADIGYAGIIGLPKNVKIVLDESMRGRRNFEMGANHTNFHSINVNFGRDIKEPEEFYDIKLAKKGYLAPNGEQLEERRGIEVGNIFQLGYHYTNLMTGAQYTLESGNRQKYYMGCYGIGVGRTMAAIAEVHHDDKGLIWPSNVAPYLVYLVQIGTDQSVIKEANELYESLKDAGIEVLFDDRDVRPGEKFADADLIGIPHRVVVSSKTIKLGKFEYKARNTDSSDMLDKSELLKTLAIAPENT